jgi:DNA helicase-2/ATP-dependent DNA helicase PcrA
MSTVLDLVDPIDDADIEWITKILHLRKLDASRRDFLMSLDSMDVSACPGSGKTTLVVAKLAILARKWKSRTQGICVLSHTNVAKREIEERLYGTDVGRLLLGYPHYIDTIHGFVNRFLAIPWLISHGHVVTAIDNDIANARRRQIMGNGYPKVKLALEKKHKSIEGLRLTTTDFADPFGDSGFPAGGRQAPSYKIAADALGEVARQGYFCHDEMLLLGEALLRDHPEVGTDILRTRFPVVLLDETQDTSSRQEQIIESALPPSRLVVQRVGDPNQAIFEDEDAAGGGPSFPDLTRRQVGLSNSFRFDHSIASHADPLAVEPVGTQGLQGLRVPSSSEPSDRHMLYLFPDGDTSQVIPAFAAHVAAVMDSAEVDAGSVVAIGEVHRLKDEVKTGDAKFPATVCHYWEGYHPNAACKTSRPKELVNYVRAARALMADGRSSAAVDIIASGVVRLANALSEVPVLQPGSRPHRALERQLAGSPTGLVAYRSILLDAAPGNEDSEAQWGKMAESVRVVVGVLLKTPATKVPSDFLDWVPTVVGGSGATSECAPKPNTYQVLVGERTIDVRMSSIHAVKGETHFATLVVETFNHSHALKSLLPWLLGERQGAQTPKGGKQAGAQKLKRLRLNYVALTRSTHVACLALPIGALGAATERGSLISRLEARGWKVVAIPAANA